MNLDPRLRDRIRRDTPARRWVLETLAAASADRTRASHALRQAQRGARKLRSRERRALFDVVYALIRGEQVWRARGRLTWEACLDAWLEDPDPADASLADRIGCIPSVADDLRQTFGDTLESWLVATNGRAPITLRTNVARTSREKLRRALAERDIETTEVGPWGLSVHGRANLQGHPAWKRGWFEVQDLGSQRIVEHVDAAGRQVLDLCAGAGGKSLAMAALRAKVTATDVRARALRELEQRAERSGARIEALQLPHPDMNGRLFQRVLVDAPCSGTGVWRRHPEYRWRATAEHLDALAKTQATLLRTGASHTALRGRLVYATCSVLRRENEAVVEAFLTENPGWRRVAPDLRTAPHLDGCDGMYAAALARC